MRNGEPLSLEEMQERQAEMEDRLNAMHAELQARAAKMAAAIVIVEHYRVITKGAEHGPAARYLREFDETQ